MRRARSSARSAGRASATRRRRARSARSSASSSVDLVGSTARAESADPEDVRAASECLLRAGARRPGALRRHGREVHRRRRDGRLRRAGRPTRTTPSERCAPALAVRDWALEDGSVEVRVAVNTGEALVAARRPRRGGRGDGCRRRRQHRCAPAVRGARQRRARRRRHLPRDARSRSSTRRRRRSRPRARRSRSRRGSRSRPEPASPSSSPPRHTARRPRARARAPARLLRARARRPLDAARHRHRRARHRQEPAGRRALRAARGRGRADRAGVTGAHCRTAKGSAFWALAEIVRAEAGIREHGLGVGHGRQARPRPSRGVIPEEDAAWVESRLRPLVGLDAGEGSRDESFGAWRRFLEALADQRPTVLVFEDLHWAGDDLLDFVDELADWVTDVPLLVVATARPELLDRRPGWGGGKRNAHTLSLAPLDRRRHRAAARRRPRPPPAAGRDAGRAARARRRQPALRRAVRPHARRARRARRGAPGECPGHHRRTARLAAGGREAAAVRRRRPRPNVLGRGAHGARRRGGAPARAPAEGVHPP